MKREQARSSCKLTGVVTTLILALLRVELEQQGALGQIVHHGGQGSGGYVRGHAGWATGWAGGKFATFNQRRASWFRGWGFTSSPTSCGLVAAIACPHCRCKSFPSIVDRTLFLVPGPDYRQ